ncbi:MAG: helix-turn-helix transcriptional regulator [Thermoleophilia bacterium]|nr:helix-turn-helix transcriptional regulator [Thermoleophilia bacterium]
MISDASKDMPNSTRIFPETLRELMALRKISYRRLATRTKLSAGYLNHLACGTRPVPADQVIKAIARALRVKPEHFFEYRQRGLQRELYRSPELADKLYDFVVSDKPLPRDLKAAIEAARRTG